MKILALETAGTACSVALWDDGECLHRYRVAARQQAELILPMLDELLAEAQLSVKQCDAIAFGRGPGAFTGVRIAASIAQGIAFASDRPVACVSTLAALALQAMTRQRADQVACAFDARMGEVYWGCFARSGDTVAAAGPEQVCAPGQVGLPDTALPWRGAGDGWAVHGTQLNLRLPVREVWPELNPQAREVACLGAEMASAGALVSPELALPVYLRDTVAIPAGQRKSSAMGAH